MKAFLHFICTKTSLEKSDLQNLLRSVVLSLLTFIIFFNVQSAEASNTKERRELNLKVDITTTTVDPIPVICTNSSSVTLSATVSPDPAGGTIQFQIDGTNAGTSVAVSGGIASLIYNPSSLVPGNHPVVAIFSGNGSVSGSTSSSVLLIVNGINPGLIAKGASAQGPACSSLNPNITLIPNGTTSKAATGNGTIAYLWQQSIDDGLTWTDTEGTAAIPSNTNVQFNPKSMTVTTRLRRVATSTLNSIVCIAYSNELEYIVYPTPIVASIIAATYNVCEGSTLQLTNVTPGGVWSSNNLASVTIDALGLIKGISASASTNATVSYKVTDGNGCSKTVNRGITVKALPELTSKTLLCNGETINLNPVSGGIWISNNPAVATVTNAGLATAITIGSASFTYTSNTAPRCANTTQMTNVVASPLATITPENFTICAGQAVTIKGNVTAAGNWTVTLNDGSTAIGTDNGSSEFEVNPATSQDYKIISLSSSSCNAKPGDLTGITSVIVQAVPVAPGTSSLVEYCKDVVANPFTATGADLLWYNVITGGTGGNTAPLPQTSIAGNIDYYVSQTVDGCESVRAKITVTVKDNCPPLPVTLIKFSLKNDENTVLINWKTTSEMNSSRFEIERSINAVKGFIKIATILSLNNKSGADYNYTDLHAIQNETNYYRLKMIDFDETFAYSRIQDIKPNNISITEIYPNPVSTYLNIKTYDWQNVISIKIRDANDRLISELSGQDLAQKLEITNLSDAIYFIEIIRKTGKSEFKRFMVAH